jgi:hypothetical protein
MSGRRRDERLIPQPSLARAAHWLATVKKMQKPFGAPLDDAARITDFQMASGTTGMPCKAVVMSAMTIFSRRCARLGQATGVR